MSGALRLNETVQLRNASLIVGLSGWGNAGEVSTFSVTYLIEKLKASQLGEIASEKFYDYQLQRPQVSEGLKDMEQKAEALDAQLAAEAEQNPELRQLIESLRAGRRAPSTRPSYTV